MLKNLAKLRIWFGFMKKIFGRECEKFYIESLFYVFVSEYVIFYYFYALKKNKYFRMDLVELEIKGISYNQSQNEAFVLILRELSTDLKLPIVIGAFEAQAIALELEKNVVPPRPLTHDLFKIFAETFDIQVTKVIIHKFANGIFFANILCEQNGVEHAIDARTSDAIALALRFKAPIFTYKSIVEKAGIYIPEWDHTPQQTTITPTLESVEKQEEVSGSRFAKRSLSELKKMLNDCIENEDYELAAQIRDEISKREQ